MSAASRRKGLQGESEVRHLLEAHGFTVRGLEGEGDHIAVRPDGTAYSVECKRRERLNIWEALTQAQTEATFPSLLFFRRNRSRWQIAGDAETILRMLR